MPAGGVNAERQGEYRQTAVKGHEHLEAVSELRGRWRGQAMSLDDVQHLGTLHRE